MEGRHDADAARRRASGRASGRSTRRSRGSPAPRTSRASRSPSGAIRRICSSRNGRHEATSSGSGLRLLGGRHFRTFAMKTSSRFMPIASMIFVRSWPARPTNARPCSSSSRPGASPTNISSAFGLPWPKTMFVRVFESLQRGQPSRNFASAGEVGHRAGHERRAPRRADRRRGRATPRSRKNSSSSRTGERRRPRDASLSPGRPDGSGARARAPRNASQIRSATSRLARRETAPARASRPQDQDLVVSALEADVRPADVVDDDQVGALGLHLPAAARLEVLRLRREGDDRLRRAAAARRLARMSRPGASRSVRVAVRRGAGARGLASGMKSATAAAMTRPSHSGNSRTRRPWRSSAVSNGEDADALGARPGPSGPASSVTRAPRSRAASASA